MLKVFQSLWAMEGLPHGGGQAWSLDEKLTRIKEAGFDGLDIPWSATFPIGREALEVVGDYGLEYTVVCFPTSNADFEAIVDTFAGSDARLLNVQGNVRLDTVEEAIGYVNGWLDTAAPLTMPVYFETHRDRMTTDLRFTLALIDAVPSMQLIADLSHFLVGEEFPWPIPARDERLIQRILARSAGYHGRIATREQIQVPFEFPQYAPLLDVFLRWWEDGFRMWRESARPGDELIFVTELGPPPYAITGADGHELSDRWHESCVIKDRVHEIWGRIATC